MWRLWETLMLENTAPKAEQTGSTVALMTPFKIWKKKKRESVMMR